MGAWSKGPLAPVDPILAKFDLDLQHLEACSLPMARAAAEQTRLEREKHLAAKRAAKPLHTQLARIEERLAAGGRRLERSRQELEECRKKLEEAEGRHQHIQQELNGMHEEKKALAAKMAEQGAASGDCPHFGPQAAATFLEGLKGCMAAQGADQGLVEKVERICQEVLGQLRAKC